MPHQDFFLRVCGRTAQIILTTVCFRERKKRSMGGVNYDINTKENFEFFLDFLKAGPVLGKVLV